MSQYQTNTHINFYEIVDEQGVAIYGTGHADEAVKWYRNAPLGSRLIVTLWESDEEDAQLIGQGVDVTSLVNKAIVAGKGE